MLELWPVCCYQDGEARNVVAQSLQPLVYLTHKISHLFLLRFSDTYYRQCRSLDVYPENWRPFSGNNQRSESRRDAGVVEGCPMLEHGFHHWCAFVNSKVGPRIVGMAYSRICIS